jgi:hypothetical protein
MVLTLCMSLRGLRHRTTARLRRSLGLESDGTAAGSDTLDVAGFAEAVADWARHLGYLAELSQADRSNARGASIKTPSDIPGDTAASVLPAVLTRAEEDWWTALEAERATWYAEAADRRRLRRTAHKSTPDRSHRTEGTSAQDLQVARHNGDGRTER